MAREILTTELKALKVNLDPTFYGTFAEIGAGQEVARNFFRVGGASGTVAKTMSAYDMAFSNSIYGEEESGRYVTQQRLAKMLHHEFELLKERLVGEKYDSRRFFTFANTVTTLNYNKNNDPHGWLGVRFQLEPHGEPNEVVMHVRLLDSDSSLQQNVLGIIGVNLIYGCYKLYDNANHLLDSLVDNLPKNSVEIDMVSMTGPAFKDVDNRILSLMLVMKGFSQATVFGADKKVYQPKDILYKKDIAVLRARFRPVTHLNIDMLENGLKLFKNEPDVNKDNILVLSEITLNNLVKEEDIVLQDFIDRADILCSLGHTVMVSNYQLHSTLVNFLSRCKPNKIGIFLGIMNVMEIFNARNYNHFEGEILNFLGILFANNVKLYAYPYQPRNNDVLYTTENIQLPEKTKHLFQYLLDNHFIQDIAGFNPECLKIFSNEVLDMIKQNKEGWEAYVPRSVADVIKEKCLFDYPCDIETKRKKLDVHINAD